MIVASQFQHPLTIIDDLPARADRAICGLFLTGNSMSIGAMIGAAPMAILRPLTLASEIVATLMFFSAGRRRSALGGVAVSRTRAIASQPLSLRRSVMGNLLIAG